MNIPRLNVIDIGARQRSRWSRRRGGAAAALVAAASLTAFAFGGGGSASALPSGLPAPVGAEARTIGDGSDSYASVVERVRPTVVTIRSTRIVRNAQQFPFGNDPFFERFFGDRARPDVEPQERRQGGLGSGVIVSPDGYILTNHHVIDGAEDITVELSDRRTFTATVVGSDAPSDLAVLRIEGGNFPALPLGNSDQVRVGDVVLAVGTPMGVGQTVTMGIISAKGRATGLGDGSFEDFLQTDAPINTGNSGGALVNTRGELIGINSQILSPSGGNIGLGFAIPANMATHVMQSLIADGRVHRGMIGVTVQTMTPDLARSLRLDSISGALVSGVQEDGPADEAGIERGDVIAKVNGETIADSNALRNTVSQMKPGSSARLTIIRDGRERELTVELDELPSQRAAAGEAEGERAGGGAGLSVQPLTPALARRMGLDADAKGLVVTDVAPAGPAAESGFRRGDIVEEVDGKPVTSASDLRAALGDADDRPALVLVRRENASIFLTLSLS